MVNIALSLTVAFVPFISQEAIAASTTAAEATGDTRFSFSDWTDSIITNPETTLSPEEAVQAFLDSMSALATRSSGLENNYTVECLTDYTNDVSAQYIAKIAALVMDRCTQPNGTVTGLTHYDLPGTKPGVMLVKNPGDFAWP
ncbi:hypothetical protein N0V85_003884 [Neurospora sp. IMI 360204]|nr:hypothetical protein N0V85_003884 [Neurospora sp. IMI 360204]